MNEPVSLVTGRGFNSTKLFNHDAEFYLVAWALGRPKAWGELNFVSWQDFTLPMLATVWRVIGKMIAEGRSPDPCSVATLVYENETDQKALQNTLVDWMVNLVSGSDGGVELAKLVKELSERRKLVAASKEIATLAEDTTCGQNAAEIAGFGVSRLMESQLENIDFVPAHEIATTMYDGLDKKVPCFRTGFPKLNAALGGGFYQGRFYGIGARMKSGKSLLMSTIAYDMVVEKEARILYLCLEMGAEETLQRILAMNMNINSIQFLKNEVRTQGWFKGRMENAITLLKNSELYFRARPRMTLDDLKATLARAGMSGKIDGVIVDYIQLVEGKRTDQSSAEHYDNVSQTLAEAVKRYPMWVLAAAQLNKEGSIRGSEGLLMACDMAFSLNKVEGEAAAGIPARAWLDTMVSRYTPYANIGSEEVPGYEFELHCGPRFREL